MGLFTIPLLLVELGLVQLRFVNLPCQLVLQVELMVPALNHVVQRIKQELDPVTILRQLMVVKRVSLKD